MLNANALLTGDGLLHFQALHQRLLSETYFTANKGTLNLDEVIADSNYIFSLSGKQITLGVQNRTYENNMAEAQQIFELIEKEITQ